MKILLSYSRLHFDPDKKPEEHKYWSSSASIIARSLYGILTEIGKVTYIDSSEYKDIIGKKFDLFIGITNNFYKTLKSSEVKKSILFAVNMHPRERTKILLKYLIRERLSPRALAGWDLVNFIESEKSIACTDYILCMGNTAVYNSYLKNKVPKSKIKMLNYAVDATSLGKLDNSPNRKTKRYIYVTSEIGLRKGFDIVYSLFTDPEIIRRKFHLDIVGLPTNNYYKKKLDEFRKELPGKIDYHGWINSSSPHYKKLLGKSDFVILPSLEEGQVGSVLDAISLGVIPIISQNTGIDFSPLGQLEQRRNSTHNRNTIIRSLNVSAKELVNLKTKTLEYYYEYHSNYIDSLRGAIKDCLNDQLYPKISIIMPIFNKEKTIMSLINLLHQACLEYKNVEVHIIFDGCTDRSETIVKKFYEDKKSYKITFEKTPNIFEVKTNNIGLRKSTGKYCVVMQDDNYIFAKNIFFEAVNFLEKNPKVAVVGGLAGVNFYPKGTKIQGNGQITMNENEVYWRQDEKTDPNLKYRIFEVDACMRGPLFLRKSFLEKHGYLDEIYAPLHFDDMDICFRARRCGYKVYCMLFDVLNASLTIANYEENKWKYWNKIYKRNCDILYSRYKPTISKDYLWLHRTKIFTPFQEKLLAIVKKVLIQKINKDYFMKSVLAYVRRLF